MPSSIIAHALRGLGVSLPQQKFVEQLLTTWLAVRGRFNFLNLGRYSSCCERTLRRGFARAFLWEELNRRLVEDAVPGEHEMVAALDASFVPKSGKSTEGLGLFFNGCAGRVEKGLEVSLLSVIDVTANTAYALHAQQTLPPTTQATTQGPTEVKATTENTPVEETRIDWYVQQVTKMRPLLPKGVKHLVVDGYYTRRKFIDGVCGKASEKQEPDLEVVGKLRCDACLRYLYNGPKKGRGRPRVYAGKVQWAKLDHRRWKDEGELEAGVRLFSARLHHDSLDRTLRVVVIQQIKAGRIQQVILFSTDTHLAGRDIVRYYKARFQIEFLFRDAKQGAGLNDCQARSAKALHFHWNAAFCALNLAKLSTSDKQERTSRCRFSLNSYKQRSSNRHLLELFSQRLGLDWTRIKSHPAYHDLCNYGVIVT